MFAKLKISGVIEIVTGLHIGGSKSFSAIGAVDSPVVRDPKTNDPIIPGSSLKGKMRTLLVRARSDSYRMKAHDNDPIEILNLFGSSKQLEEGRMPISRLKFSDCFITNKEALRNSDIRLTEIKFENTINRTTAVANPRQIERVIRGVEFGLDIIYDVDKEEELLSDFKIIQEGLKWLETDYLGGHGSRGSGKIAFKDLKVTKVIGELSDNSKIEECNRILNTGA